MKNTFAYTAGYIDWDGCFYIGKTINPVKYPCRITISSTNKNILEFFKESYFTVISIRENIIDCVHKLNFRGINHI